VKVALVGLGAVGTRVAHQMAADPAITSLIILHREPRSGPLPAPLADARARPPLPSLESLLAASSAATGPDIELRSGVVNDLPSDVDVVVLTHPSGVREQAEVALQRGAHVVSTADSPAEVRRLLALDGTARRLGRTVAVGAAMAPGLSCVLAAFGRARFDVVDQIHVASLGTGGPACARRHHAALSSMALDWIEGSWRRRPGGSGRELVWFPEPAGGADCYRAGLPDPLLLVPAFPDVKRVTARLAANRRDRTTSWMPMLRRPHPEGLVGAVRVELRGWRDGIAVVRVFGATARPAVIAGTVASLVGTWAGQERLARTGAAGLAELVDDPGLFLRELHPRGIRTALFEGSEPEL
jgi:saccharopine dehydrogenase-like NADP-dependent oxidoreductase